MYTFQTPEPMRLNSRSGAGTVRVEAADTATTTVELTALRDGDDERTAIADATVNHTGGAVTIDVGRHHRGLFRGKPQIGVVVTVPRGSFVSLEAESADISTSGALHTVSARTGSGNVRIDEATAVDVTCGSGDAEVRHCTERLKATSGSGNIEAADTGQEAKLAAGSGSITVGTTFGNLSAKTGSGDVEVQDSGGTIVAKSGSGDLRFRAARSGTVSATSASGDVDVAVVAGAAAWLDLNTVTGDVSNELDDVDAPGEDDRTIELRIKTATGDISIRRA